MAGDFEISERVRPLDWTDETTFDDFAAYNFGAKWRGPKNFIDGVRWLAKLNNDFFNKLNDDIICFY